MPGANYMLDKTWRLNAAQGQYLAVKFVAADQDAAAPVDTLGEEVIGILQSEVTATQFTDGDTLRAVRPIGISFAIAGAAINPGTRLRVNAAGRMVALAAATANQNQVGIAYSKPGADGDLMTVFLTPGVKVTTT